MRLYGIGFGRFWTVHGLFDLVQSTVGVKHGCTFSLAPFGIYIDGLEDFLQQLTHVDDGCMLQHVLMVGSPLQ